MAPGTPVEVKEINSAFKWGTNVPDAVGTFLAPGSQYSTLLKQNFNSITPENAGKWAESDTTSQLNNLDILTNFAAQNNIRVRMHNVVWGSQQPTAINTDFTNAQSANPTTAAAGKAAITSALANRVANYVGGINSLNGAVRTTQYGELDVYNESYNTGANASASTGDNYWKVMGGGTAAGGAAWEADWLYNQGQTVVAAAGAEYQAVHQRLQHPEQQFRSNRTNLLATHRIYSQRQRRQHRGCLGDRYRVVQHSRRRNQR